jgi:hypothetical protein
LADLSEFDRAVAVTATGSAYDATLDAGWQIGSGVNGGLLLAVAGNALRATFADSGHPDPVSVSAYYLAASRTGPARSARGRTARRGRSMFVRADASLVQTDGGREVERIMTALATFARPGGYSPTTCARPPRPLTCRHRTSVLSVRRRAAPSLQHAVVSWDRLRTSGWTPACAGFAIGQALGAPRRDPRGWAQARRLPLIPTR